VSHSKDWRNDTGKLHREDGPAWIYYDSDGLILRENFFINGEPHREDGPSDIWYNPDGSILREHFWFHKHFLGAGSFGFWALWHKLTHEQQQNHNLLKYLVRYS